jgi:lipopolysaccharide biosynthesis glycosyltransferase
MYRMRRSYNIVTACDDEFAQHTAVMLTSLFYHHPDCLFQVFILVPADFLEENALKIIASFPGNFGTIKIIRVSDDVISNLVIYGHVTTASYLRLRIGELLPATLERVLYLDPDIIIAGDVTELFEMDLLGFPFGAVPDVLVDVDREIRAKIAIGANAHYFNAGVLLIDLPRWRSLNMGARAINYCHSYPSSITYHDQCALNHVTNGRCYVLDEKWNFQTKSSARNLHSALIIHFTGLLKPWHFLCTHPLKPLYFEFIKKTAWKDFKVRWTYRELIRRILGPTMSRAAVAAADRIRKRRGSSNRLGEAGVGGQQADGRTERLQVP